MQFFDVNEGESPFIYHAPHGGTMIPDSERENFIICPAKMNEEILNLTDWLTEVMAEELAEKSNSSSFVNHVSRLVCDPERFPDSRESMEKVGMGFAYTHGYNQDVIRELEPDDKKRIKDTFYDPYAKEFSHLVNRKLAAHGTVCIIDIHSYSTESLPYELNQTETRPQICIGVDDYHLNTEVMGALISTLEETYEVSLNTPFSGSYIPLEHYKKTPEVLSIMIEIRRDLYMNEETGTVKKEEFTKLLEKLEEAQRAILHKVQ